MKSDLREFVVMDRVIHEPARLLIITLLYPAATMDFFGCGKCWGPRRGSVQSSGKAGNRGVRRAAEEIPRQAPHDYLQPYKKRPRGDCRRCGKAEESFECHR